MLLNAGCRGEGGDEEGEIYVNHFIRRVPSRREHLLGPPGPH